MEMHTTTAHQFTIKTWTDTRSNRRDRTYTVTAATATDATAEAERRAIHDTRTRSSVTCRIIDVDGHGIPTDCEHMQADRFGPFVWRWDGAKDCHACAGDQAA